MSTNYDRAMAQFEASHEHRRCAECGETFCVEPGRQLYCPVCLPEGYVLSAPLQRAEAYPDDDPDLSLELEPLDDTDA